MSAAFAFAAPRRARRPSLTPLVDVVFLLLVFFMLASRFGPETTLPLAAGTAGTAPWEGPPRLIDVTPEGPRLNGVAVAPETLAAALAPLMPEPDSPVVLRVAKGAEVQALADLLGRLKDAGHSRLVVLD